MFEQSDTGLKAWHETKKAPFSYSVIPKVLNILKKWHTCPKEPIDL